MATASLNQVFDITLSTPDIDGKEVALDSPLVWASSDETVYQPHNVSPDGKSGQIKAVGFSHKDGTGNDIAVFCSFSGDGDPSVNVKPLNAITEELFCPAPADATAQQIVITMGPAHDDMVPQ